MCHQSSTHPEKQKSRPLKRRVLSQLRAGASNSLDSATEEAIDWTAESNGWYPDEKRINLQSVDSMTALSTIRNALGFLRKPMLQKIDVMNEYAEKGLVQIWIDEIKEICLLK